jgi:hypothetical protein
MYVFILQLYFYNNKRIHFSADGTHLCVECYTQNVFDIKTEQPDEGESNSANNDEKKTRKSTRTTRFKNRSTATVTTNHSKAVPKGLNNLFTPHGCVIVSNCFINLKGKDEG